MIDNNRLNHIIAVARLMKETCIKNNCESTYIEEMFILGYVHDVGYEFVEGAKHNEKGGLILEEQNYKYFNEVQYHGVPNCEYHSNELDLLNWADMHIDGKGQYVTFEQRLSDIAMRRGIESEEYIKSTMIIDELKAKGYC